MSTALVTIICPLADANIEKARAAIDALGNPATDSMRAQLKALREETNGRLAIHFASMTVLPATGGGGYLVFEFSGDGRPDELIRELARRFHEQFQAIFAQTKDRGARALDAYLSAHRVSVGHGYFDNPGLLFGGTPGLSVVRILKEKALASKLAHIVDQHVSIGGSALEHVRKARVQLEQDPQWQWALTPEPARALDPERTLISALPAILASVAKTYLWPLLIPPLLVFVTALLMDLSMEGFGMSVIAAVFASIVTVLAALVLFGFGYIAFRRRESSEQPPDVAPYIEVVAGIMDRENRAAQNHLAAVSVMKPGVLRKLTLRFALAAISEVATKVSRPGWLGTLGTIHFARWVMVPRTGDLLFMSNYAGSWESYLEDFITKASNGLSAVWSNTEGFPKTANLIQLGAADGARFKRWSRRQQTATGFWYTAYPDLTTAHIRNNAAIRQGLGTVLTEEEAQRWLSLFGSQARPASALESPQIQSIVFGGLGFLRYGMCLGFVLSDDRKAAQQWLRSALPSVAFGDGRKHRDGAVIMALAASSLYKLDLQRESILTFPQAFLDGMCASWRSRNLGDEGENAPKHWEWGNPQRNVDGIMLLYAKDDGALATLRDNMVDLLKRHGHTSEVEIRFVPLPEKDKQSGGRADVEPFGFLDGVSQPIIRGTYKALRGADPIHIVEAGEFILGYPDNRGYLPDTPTLAAMYDPEDKLPITANPEAGFARPIVNEPRDIGRNGTFLTVRQLSQDVEQFESYCAFQAANIAPRFPDWMNITAEFVAAKMIGRWKDGSSLVRYPYRPATDDGADEHPMTRAPQGTATAPARAALPAAPAAPAASQSQATQKRKAIAPDNDFLFGAEDPQALRCPFGAHIRRTNPRDSFTPGSQDQLAISNRHRILRIGRLYGKLNDRAAGLFFMCLNSDLERQFEFVQQTWIQRPAFHGLASERDPLMGNRHQQGEDDFTIPTHDGPVLLRQLPEFVHTRGGGYFFIPGKALLQYLSRKR